MKIQWNSVTLNFTKESKFTFESNFEYAMHSYAKIEVNLSIFCIENYLKILKIMTFNFELEKPKLPFIMEYIQASFEVMRYSTLAHLDILNEKNCF